MTAVLDARDGAVLGYAGLQHLEGGKDVEIGYYLARRAWGNGLASELARELVRFGFENLVLPRILAVVRPENDASKAVLRKAGLDFVEHGYHYRATVEFWAIYAILAALSADLRALAVTRRPSGTASTSRLGSHAAMNQCHFALPKATVPLW